MEACLLTVDSVFPVNSNTSVGWSSQSLETGCQRKSVKIFVSVGVERVSADLYSYSSIVHRPTVSLVLPMIFSPLSPHCLPVSFITGLCSTVEGTWSQTQALLAVKGSQASTNTIANAPGVSP